MTTPPAHTSATQVVTAVVRAWVAPVLKERGYVRSGSTWHQVDGPLTRVFQVQRGRGNSARFAAFYLNGSVYAGALEQLLGRPALSRPDEPSCHLRLRPHDVDGSMSPSHHVAPDTDIDELGPNVAREVGVLLDRLNEVATVEELVDELSHRDLAQYQCVYGWYLQAGRPVDADAFRARLEERFGHEARWRVLEKHLTEIAVRFPP